MKSQKEISLERKIMRLVKPHDDVARLVDFLLNDEALHELQEYANTVSIRRLGYNDHGPVHMRQVALNAVVMLDLLAKAGVKTALETDECGTVDDSRCAVFMAAFLHDIGMSVGRHNHEHMSCVLAMPIIARALDAVFPGELHRNTVIRCLTLEGIAGHMATQRVHSLEAGLILVADGCDMEKGRARIPMKLNTLPRTGDIHKYSANSIERVRITAGKEKPVLIDVEMTGDVGFFQIEEVLLPKIDSSPAKPFIALHAGVKDEPRKKYL